MPDMDPSVETERLSDDSVPPTQPPTDDSVLTRAAEARDETSISTRLPGDSDLSPESLEPHDRSARPDHFPGYTLLETLGEGGMGVVYKARQEGLKRMVALKVIDVNRRVGPKDLIRFLAEAEAVASIKHPHVVLVHEYGEAAGRPFLAMEYLSGGTLADRLKQVKKFEPRAAAELLAKLARAVQAAHDQGIVHRDLKPANVLFDAGGEPKVADFGLAKRSKGNDLTRTQAVMGTPSYMSPEQAKGDTKFVGPTADVYALGVVLYECLTGLRPFHDADTHVLLRKVIEDDPARPTQHVPGLPRDLELIALKCLAKDPEDRYPTARQLADDLAHFVAGEPVSVRSASTIERSLKWARRKPTQAIACALTFAVVILSAFGISLAVLWRNAEQAKVLADGEKRNALIAREGEKKARLTAEQARDQVNSARRELVSFEYGRTMQVAHQDWRDSNFVESLALLNGIRPELRGWEWKYLLHLNHDEILNLKGHDNGVSSVCWSPDGSRVATASWDKTVRIWDSRTGAQTLALKGHAKPVASVSWSPDGSRIATRGGDGMVRIWDATSGTEALALKGHAKPVTSVRWSPDGSRLATSGVDGMVRVWDAASGLESFVLKPAMTGVASHHWSPDGSRLAVAGPDHLARIYDSRSGAEILKLVGHSLAIGPLSWSPDGSWIATGGDDGTARVWNAKSGAQSLSLLGQGGTVTSVSWSPDGTRLGTSSRNQPRQAGDSLPEIVRKLDETIRVWDSKDGSEILVIKGLPGPKSSVCWSPDGTMIAAADADHVARAWDTRSGAEVIAIKGHTSSINSVSWSPDGSRIATASMDATARIWDARIGAESLVFKGHTYAVNSVAWSPNSRFIATGGYDCTARVWDARSGAQVRTFSMNQLEGGEVFSVAWSPDGSRLVIACQNGKATIWNARSGTKQRTLNGHRKAILSASWSPDGSQIVTVSLDDTARVWDADSGLEKLALNVHDNSFLSASWSPDGTRIATVIQDEFVRIWDAKSGALVGEMKGNADSPTSLSWSPDGLRIVTGNRDATLRVWDSRSGAELLTFRGHTDYVKSVSWSPDGARIASGGADGMARVWDAKFGAELLTLKGNKSKAAISSIRWSPDGLSIATAGEDETARVWDAKSGAERLAPAQLSVR